MATGGASYVLGGGAAPTVVFEAGSNYAAENWGILVDEISKQTKVVATDRPGLGWSDRAPKKRTLNDVADQQHALLTEAGVRSEL